MWGKFALERKLANLMGYDYCWLFDTARSALLAWRKWSGDHRYPSLPSNVCPALREILPAAPLVPVNPLTGMAHGVMVQMYGYRNTVGDRLLEIDPLMTGYLRGPLCHNSIISFGPKKMLDVGGGGALLSNVDYKFKPWFPLGLREYLAWKLGYFRREIEFRRRGIDGWDRVLGDSCGRIPQEQIMPWRVMRRIPKQRDAVVRALRQAGHAVGTNYPPLPGVTDEGAIHWGNQVINFFPDQDPWKATEIIKGVIGDGYHS